MQSEMPFFDSPEDALRAAVQLLGGAKQVGAKLWPDLTPDAAGRKMLDCLNLGRAERLSLGQVMKLLQWARDAGHHAPMAWICSEVGYEAKPVAREEELDRVALAVEHSSKTLAAALATLERLQRVNRLQGVA
jgi:hypothetical protein